MEKKKIFILALLSTFAIFTLITPYIAFTTADANTVSIASSPRLQQEDDQAENEDLELIATVIHVVQRVNLRTTPATDKPPIRGAAVGETFLVHEGVEPVDDGTYLWLPILVEGEEAWIAGNFVEIETVEGDRFSLNNPLGQGFWKNHPDIWSVEALTLGDQTYTQEELLEILQMPVEGDASLNLAHQLIAAKLNVANGTPAEPVEEFIAEADALLAEFEGSLPYDTEPSSDAGQAMVDIAGELDDYNSGKLTDETDTVAVTIAGPVIAIEANTVTIYNFDIEFDPDAPVLTVVQIGDVIQVTADLAEEADVIVVVVVTNVIFLSVEAFVNADFTLIWIDRGGCFYAPPPWADASYWYARCTSSGGASGMGTSGMGASGMGASGMGGSK